MPTTPTTLRLTFYPALAAHHYAEVFALCAFMKTDDTPLASGLPLPIARPTALREPRVTT